VLRTREPPAMIMGTMAASCRVGSDFDLDPDGIPTDG
jgi:hypothetical protein